MRDALISTLMGIVAASALAFADETYEAPPHSATRAVIAFEVMLEPRDAASLPSTALLVVGDGAMDCRAWGEVLCKWLSGRLAWRDSGAREFPNTCMVVTDADVMNPGLAQLAPAGSVYLAQRDNTWSGAIYETASVKYLVAFVVEGDKVSGSAEWRSTEPGKSFRKALKGRVLKDFKLSDCLARADAATKNFLRPSR